MKPAKDEYAPPFSRYIDLVTEDDILPALERQGESTAALLASIPEERGAHRYAPDKWSIKQVVNHMADAERIFNYRTVSIARGETRPLPPFDEEAFGKASDADRRPLREIAEELLAIRRSTVALFGGLSPAAWTRVGVANDHRTSVRALAYVTLGHERHHLKVLRERYL